MWSPKVHHKDQATPQVTKEAAHPMARSHNTFPSSAICYRVGKRVPYDPSQSNGGDGSTCPWHARQEVEANWLSKLRIWHYTMVPFLARRNTDHLSWEGWSERCEEHDDNMTLLVTGKHQSSKVPSCYLLLVMGIYENTALLSAPCCSKAASRAACIATNAGFTRPKDFSRASLRTWRRCQHQGISRHGKGMRKRRTSTRHLNTKINRSSLPVRGQSYSDSILWTVLRAPRTTRQCETAFYQCKVIVKVC